MRRLLFIFILLTAISASSKELTVVIDAGHGGRDIGAPGINVHEKVVNLNVALLLGRELKKELGDNVKVLYTRDDDTFIKLADRAKIANKANADLFVSIHCNSIANKSRQQQVKGASVYVRGFASSQQASEVAALENSALELEDNSSSTMSAEESVFNDLVWNRNLEESIKLASELLDELVVTADRHRGAVEQNDLAVLKRTKMPAVLVELDFICNNSIEKFLASDKGQRMMAQALSNGIIKYSDLHNKKLKRKSDANKKAQAWSEKPADKPKQGVAEAKPKPQAKPKTKEVSCEEGVRYKVQFLISNKKLPVGSPKFKGLNDVDSYSDGGVIKYTSGSYRSEEEAKREAQTVRKKFPDAFVIKTKDGKRIK